jgi:hypothetical protein
MKRQPDLAQAAIITVLSFDKDRAWTDWGGQARTMLSDRLREACPSLRLTERKRLAKSLLKGGGARVRIEVEAQLNSVHHMLESLGAMMRIEKELDETPGHD